MPKRPTPQMKSEDTKAALPKLFGRPMTKEEALAMRGMGYETDLDELRPPGEIVEFDVDEERLRDLETFAEQLWRRRVPPGP